MEGSGLLGGITAWHLRMLCENPWNGGAGYTPEQVSRMTLDQIWFRLCDSEVLKREVGVRTKRVSGDDVTAILKPDKDGMLSGIARDGTPIRGKFRGKSKAREAIEKYQEEQRQKRRRKGRGI